MFAAESLPGETLPAESFPAGSFSVETIDGCRLGRIRVPCSQVADWLNFLVAPQYQAAFVFAEQCRETIDLYFEAAEGVYFYLEARLNQASSPWFAR
ncbi:MAG: hypothetical protein VKK04_21390 [Synechococcales bacterium]|nr:hypothetical protein [Synechococcales bacterium]